MRKQKSLIWKTMQCIFRKIPNISGTLWDPSFSGIGRREKERLFKGNELREKVKRSKRE